MSQRSFQGHLRSRSGHETFVRKPYRVVPQIEGLDEYFLTMHSKGHSEVIQGSSEVKVMVIGYLIETVGKHYIL